MRWVFKYLVRLLVLAAIVFAGYAFFAELPPPTDRVTVELEPPAAAEGETTGN